MTGQVLDQIAFSINKVNGAWCGCIGVTINKITAIRRNVNAVIRRSRGNLFFPFAVEFDAEQMAFQGSDLAGQVTERFLLRVYCLHRDHIVVTLGNLSQQVPFIVVLIDM